MKISARELQALDLIDELIPERWESFVMLTPRSVATSFILNRTFINPVYTAPLLDDRRSLVLHFRVWLTRGISIGTVTWGKGDQCASSGTLSINSEASTPS